MPTFFGVIEPIHLDALTPIFTVGLISNFFSNRTLEISIEIPYKTSNMI